MRHILLTTALLGILLVSSSPARAQTTCEEQLAELDERLADDPDLSDAELRAIQTLRDMMGRYCEQGNDEMVQQMLETLLSKWPTEEDEQDEPADARPDDEPDADEQGAFALGTPRDDLERFYGVYGDPNNPGRDFFVAPARRNPDALQQIPEGYLMVGAMWGDVAPWYMKSVSDTRFEQQWVGDFGEQTIVEFELGDSGQAVALRFETVFDDRGRLERLRDLPGKWR